MRENRKKRGLGLVIIVGTKKLPPAAAAAAANWNGYACLLAYLLTVERVSPVGRIPLCFNLSGRLVGEVGEWMNGSAEWKGRQKRGQVVCVSCACLPCLVLVLTVRVITSSC